MGHNFLFPIIFLFCVFSTKALVASAVIGVDLGTEYIKATLVKPGIPLDIVLTKDTRRKEISAIAFKPEKTIKSGHFPERLYGSDAIALASRLPGDVYPNLKPLLGLGIDNPIVKEYASRHPMLKLTTDKIRGTTAFKSQAFSAEELPWTVEEILAMELQNVQKNAQVMAGKGTVIKDLVITVPTFFTVEEKRAVLIAADLAGLRVLELISDGLAVGINYATTRTFPSINEGGKAETHLIFDMGAGSTTASVLRFQGKTVKDVGKFNKTIQEIKVLGTGWDRTLGGDFFNSIIVDDIVAQFVASPIAKKKSLEVDVIKSKGKIASKLYKEAEKMRQVLSANTNTQTFFEELYEDVDFKYKITRANFEKLTEPHVARISATIQKSLDTAGLKIKDLDTIILHGGASRTPFVQRELENFFGDTRKIKTNVNSDESAVFGAGFRGAALSPSFRVKEIRISDSMACASGVRWTNAQGKTQSQGLWKTSSAIGDEKHYIFKNYQEPLVLTFYQRIPSLEESSLEFVDKEILVATTQNLTESISLLTENHGCTKADITVRLGARVTPESGEVDITKFVVGCETEASVEKESVVNNVKGLFGFGKKEQAPISDKEANDSSSITTTLEESTSSASRPEPSPPASESIAQENMNKTTKIKHSIPLEFTTEIKGRPQLPTSEITRMKERLSAFSRSDNIRRMRDESLNQLEGLTYKVRDFLEDSEFISVSTQHERKKLETKSEDISDWIYSDGIEASKEELKQRLQELEDIISPIEFRKAEISTRPEKIIALQSALNETNQLIMSVTEQISRDKKKLSEILASNSMLEASATEKTSSVEEPTSSQGEESTTTKTAQIEKQTFDPVYTESDLTTSKTLFEEYSLWLTEKLVEQEKLEKTENPVLLSKDIDEKVKKLQDANVQILMKNIQQAYRSKSSTSDKKPKKTPETKTKVEKADKSSGVPSATFTVGPGEKIPSQEEMLEHLKKFENMETESEPVDSKKEDEESKTDSKHDEL